MTFPGFGVPSSSTYQFHPEIQQDQQHPGPSSHYYQGELRHPQPVRVSVPNFNPSLNIHMQESAGGPPNHDTPQTNPGGSLPNSQYDTHYQGFANFDHSTSGSFFG